MKHLYIVNASGESFVGPFTTVAERYGVSPHTLFLKHMVLWVRGDRDVAIIHEDQEINRNDCFFYFKKTIDDKVLVSIVSCILDTEATPFNDRESNLRSGFPSAKIPMMVRLALHSLPVPRSFICTTHSYKKNKTTIEDNISFPCVVKKAGSQGKNVWKIDTEKELKEKIDQDEKLTLVQEYVPNNSDIRVIIVENECIGAIQRTSADGFYNNISQGGKATKVDITEQEKQDALKAVHVSGLSVAGVDLMRVEGGGHVILEVNRNPSRDLFDEALGFSVTERIAEIIIRKYVSEK